MDWFWCRALVTRGVWSWGCLWGALLVRGGGALAALTLCTGSTCVCAAGPGEARHNHPRVEELPALQGGDGERHQGWLQGPALCPLVPQPHLLRAGLDGSLPGGALGFHRCVPRGAFPSGFLLRGGSGAVSRDSHCWCERARVTVPWLLGSLLSPRCKQAAPQLSVPQGLKLGLPEEQIPASVAVPLCGAGR